MRCIAPLGKSINTFSFTNSSIDFHILFTASIDLDKCVFPYSDVSKPYLRATLSVLTLFCLLSVYDAEVTSYEQKYTLLESNNSNDNNIYVKSEFENTNQHTLRFQPTS